MFHGVYATHTGPVFFSVPDQEQRFARKPELFGIGAADIQ